MAGRENDGGRSSRDFREGGHWRVEAHLRRSDELDEGDGLVT
jgi:hypothetical protein